MKRILNLSLVLSVATLSSAQIPNLHVSSISYDHKLPLTESLRVVGLHLKGGFVSFGVDIEGDSEPEVEVSMSENRSLGDALQQITSQVPGYTSEIVSEHVIEIYPISQRLSQSSPLNLPIREFSVKGVPATMILSSPARYISDLKDYLSQQHSELGCGSIGPGLGSHAVGVTLFLTGRTLRQIFDAVAEADADVPSTNTFRLDPVGWVHREKSDPKSGVVHVWSSVSFVPRDWRLYAPK